MKVVYLQFADEAEARAALLDADGAPRYQDMELPSPLTLPVTAPTGKIDADTEELMMAPTGWVYSWPLVTGDIPEALAPYAMASPPPHAVVWA